MKERRIRVRARGVQRDVAVGAGNLEDGGVGAGNVNTGGGNFF